MTYEYLCEACGHEWEAEQSISERPLKKCPECKKQKARRQISGGTGFLLKGDGWYADGYSSSRKTQSDGESKSEKSASSSEKSDDSSKPDKPSDGGTKKKTKPDKKKGKSAA